MLLVGLPVLALMGILEAGRAVAAPLSIRGEWTLEFDSGATCARDLAALKQPALSISQSGPDVIITLNDGHGSTYPATLDGSALHSALLVASISGKYPARVLDGRINLAGCAPAGFHAVRQIRPKTGDK
jgi:hypothetical protein